MGKISSYISNTAIALTDYILGDSSTGPQTKVFTIQNLINFFWSLANIPSGGTSPITRDNESQFAFIVNNTGVWSGDSYGSSRAASMTALTCYINGRRIVISAVTSRVFTASKDTYVDVLDNGDGTGTLVYTEVTNNSASPALASNSVRLAIIITGASNIANSGSVNQGQETMVLPIASSIPYAVTDSLGNLICPRDPNRKILGYRQITSNSSALSNNTAVSGLSVPVIVPSTRKIKVKVWTQGVVGSASGFGYGLSIWDGTVGSGTLLAYSSSTVPSNSALVPGIVEVITSPSSTSKTYNVGVSAGSGTGTVQAGSSFPAFIKVELE